MEKIKKIYTLVTAILATLTFVSLSVSSLAVTLEYSYLAYFWYLALGGIAMIVATSLLMGVALVVHRVIKRYRRLLNTEEKPTADISPGYDATGVTDTINPAP